MQRQQVQFLIVELRSQMLCGLTKKFKNIFSWSVFYFPDCFGEGNGNPLQYSCLGNPMDRGAWQATVHGVTGIGWSLVTKPPFFSWHFVSKRTLLKSLSLCFSNTPDGLHSHNCSKMIKEKLPNWLLSSLSHCSYSSNSLITILPFLDMGKMEVWVILRKKNLLWPIFLHRNCLLAVLLPGWWVPLTLTVDAGIVTKILRGHHQGSSSYSRLMAKGTCCSAGHPPLSL